MDPQKGSMIYICGHAGTFQDPTGHMANRENFAFLNLPMSIYAFLYGTLRAGQSNDIVRAAAARGLEPPIKVASGTVPGRLVDFGDWPGLIEAPDAPLVVGDIYEISPAVLAMMDEIEGFEPGRASCFVRRSVTVTTPDGPMNCQYYPIDEALRGQAIDIEGGDWISYFQARTGKGAAAP